MNFFYFESVPFCFFFWNFVCHHHRCEIEIMFFSIRFATFILRRKNFDQTTKVSISFTKKIWSTVYFWYRVYSDEVKFEWFIEKQGESSNSYLDSVTRNHPKFTSSKDLHYYFRFDYVTSKLHWKRRSLSWIFMPRSAWTPSMTFFGKTHL